MEWSIQARSHQCQECGRAFRNKETLHTLLRDEQNAYHRRDVCESCWVAHFAEGANHRRGFVSCWQSVYSPPAPPAPEAIKKETAETLLRKLVARDDPQHAGACFILAVMLERKRLLRVKSQTIEADCRVLIYEHPKSGDIFTIPDPKLQLDQLEAVQRDVAGLLEHGLDPAPADAGLVVPPSETGSPAQVPDAGDGAGSSGEPVAVESQEPPATGELPTVT